MRAAGCEAGACKPAGQFTAVEQEAIEAAVKWTLSFCRNYLSNG